MDTKCRVITALSRHVSALLATCSDWGRAAWGKRSVSRVQSSSSLHSASTSQVAAPHLHHRRHQQARPHSTIGHPPVALYTAMPVVSTGSAWRPLIRKSTSYLSSA